MNEFIEALEYSADAYIDKQKCDYVFVVMTYAEYSVMIDVEVFHDKDGAIEHALAQTQAHAVIDDEEDENLSYAICGSFLSEILKKKVL